MRRLTFVAWFNVVIHGCGLVLALVGMRPGTPLVELAERMAYLQRGPVGWTVGWGVWMVCALALLALFLVVVKELGEPALGRAAVLLGGMGAVVDLLCDAANIAVLPSVAARGDRGVLLALERLTGVGGAVVANGLYSIGALLLARCLRGRGAAEWLGYGVFAAGMGMVVAGFTGVPRHLELATGPTIGLFCLWALAVARSLGREAR